MARIVSGENPSSSNPTSRRWGAALLWSAVIGLELFLLLDDITLFRSPKLELPVNTGERIAEIVSLRGGVRWQSPKDVVWNEGAAGQVLFEDQSLMTLSDSEARLVFDDVSRPGSRPIEGPADRENLEIGPGTLIQLRRAPPVPAGADAPLLLLLDRGSVRGKVGARTLVASSGSGARIELAPGSRFEAASEGRNPGANVQLKVLEGSAIVRDPTSSSPRTLSPGDSFTLGSKDASPAIPIPARAAPAPRAAAPETRIAPKSRALPPPPKPHPPVIRPRLGNPASGASLVPSPRIRVGRAVWDAFRLVREARADENAAAVPVHVDAWDVDLAWDAVPGAAKYRVQIAKSKSFKSPILDETTEKPNLSWLYRRGMENKKGRVYYRIASVDADGRAGAYSAPVPIEIPREAPTTTRAAKDGSPSPSAGASAAALDRSASAPSSVPRATIAPLVQYGAYSQSSDPQLFRGVSTRSAFVSEGLRAAFRLAPSGTLRADLATNEFQSDGGTLAKARSIRATVAYSVPLRALGSRFSWGGLATLDDRFTKSAPSAIRLERGVALGALIGYDAAEGDLARGGLRATLSVPLSGAVASGPYGARLEIEERVALRGGSGWAPGFLSVGATGEESKWDEPAGGSVRRWAIRLGPEWTL